MTGNVAIAAGETIVLPRTDIDVTQTGNENIALLQQNTDQSSALHLAVVKHQDAAVRLLKRDGQPLRVRRTLYLGFKEIRKLKMQA